MRIPTYTAKFNPSNRAPGASIRARKSFSVAQSEIDKAAPLNAFLGEVAEISLGRYRVAEELKLEENLLAAATQLASLENVMANDANIYSVLDGDQPRWNQQVNEIKTTLQNNIGTNLNSRLKFESKFNIAENSARTRLRKKVDAAIAARAALALKQKEDVSLSKLNSKTNQNEYNFIINEFIRTTPGFTAKDKNGQLTLTNKGLIARNSFIQKAGTIMINDFINDNPEKGVGFVFDLINFNNTSGNSVSSKLSKLPENFEQNIGSGILEALFNLDDVYSSELLIKNLSSATSARKDFDDFQKNQEDELIEKRSEFINDIVIIQNSAVYNQDQALELFNDITQNIPSDIKVLKNNVEQEIISQTQSQRSITGFDLKNIFNSMVNVNPIGLQSRFSQEERDALSSISRTETDRSIQFGDEFAIDRLKNKLDDLLLDNQLTHTMLRKTIEEYPKIDGYSLLPNTDNYRNIISEYKDKIRIYKENQTIISFVNERIKEEKERSGANLAELENYGNDSLVIAAARHVNIISSELLRFVDASREKKILLTQEMIREELSKIKKNNQTEFQRVIVEDAIEQIKIYNDRNRRDDLGLPLYNTSLGESETFVATGTTPQLARILEQSRDIGLERLRILTEEAPRDIASQKEIYKEIDYFERALRNFGINY